MAYAYPAYRTYESGRREQEARRRAWERARRRRKRRQLRTVIVLLLLAAAVTAAGYFYFFQGFSGLFSKKPGMENVRTDFVCDLDAIAAGLAGREAAFSPQPSDLAALEELKEQVPQYEEELDFFLEHIAYYDQEGVNTVLLSPEKLEFVLLEPVTGLQYAQGADIAPWEGRVPYLIQYDRRWAFHPYGSGPMGYTACGPTSLSMAVMGLTGNTAATPNAVADYAAANGYYVSGSGTSWSLFTQGCRDFGLRGETISVTRSAMDDCLNSGGVLIASVSAGDFTMNGHILVIAGKNLTGYRVYDPSSIARSSETWSFQRLSPQIAQLWAMYPAES